MNKYIPVNAPVIGKREKELVNECLNTGWISSEGPFVSRFEEEMSRKVGRKYGIACSSGTAALDLAVAALDLKPGDEVIMPSFTIISCANSIIRSGAIPVLVDSDINNFNIKVENIESVISPKTVAIMAVHIYGLPVDMNPIIKLAEKYNLAIIEDAAELIGGEYKGLPCGSFGTVSTFSFYPNKHITTGEGGMVLTNDRSIAERCRSLRNLGFQPHNRFVHNEIGWNYRMTNIQAALGIAQLERLDHSINKKIWIGKTYMEKLSDLKYIQLPIKETNYAKNIFWVFGILVEEDFGFAKNIMLDLAKRNIGTRPFFYPMHLQPIFNKLGLFKNVNCPNSEKLYRQGFYIPSGLNLNIEDIDYVVEQLKTILD